jgi:hypothetical protein
MAGTLYGNGCGWPPSGCHTAWPQAPIDARDCRTGRGHDPHFTPTSASWLNAVEGFFAKLSSKRLKRGVFSGIVDLQAAINRFLAEANERPKPFVWTADPDGIIEKVRRGREALAGLG